jgi:hypothetical protein
MKSSSIAFLLLACLAAGPSGAAQQPPPPAPPRDASSSKQPPAKEGKYANHIVLSGTIFTERGFSVPGAQVQLRRAGEKKVRAQDVASRVGEFFLHAPRGFEYELTVRAPGLQDQTMKIEASSGDRQDLVFRLKAAPAGKKK